MSRKGGMETKTTETLYFYRQLCNVYIAKRVDSVHQFVNITMRVGWFVEGVMYIILTISNVLGLKGNSDLIIMKITYF